MSLLERIVIAHRCRSTHHFIAMDALPLITGTDAEKWRNLILVHNEDLLKGAKAPDAVFKDFKNHVLHIGEGEWGGARDAAMAWYAEAVGYLREKKWAKAIYALGVLSHYYADPIQPFHTGQTEEEGAIHRAVEWSIAKSRATIKKRIDEIGYPHVAAGDGAGFVSDMVRAGAEKSHRHYHTLIDHYNLDAGAVNPPAGLDQAMIDIVAELVAYATAGLGTLYSRAFAEAGIAAPNVHITVPGYLAALDIPIHWISKKLDNAADKRTVTAMYREYKKTGKVIKALPEDDKAIRKLHARQVLRCPLQALDAQALRPLGQSHEPRPEYAEFARKIAEAMAPEVEIEVETEAETETASVAAAPDVKPAKKKLKMRIVADVPVAEEVVEAETVVEDLEEAARLAGEAQTKLEAQEALRVASEARARQEAQTKARFEAEEMARIEAEEEAARLAQEEAARIEAKETARFEAREAAEFARLEAEEAAELARMEAEELARLEAEQALDNDYDDEADAYEDAKAYEDEDESEEIEAADDDEFSLEELAAFSTNLTEDGDLPAPPPVASFFDKADSGRTRTRLLREDQVVDAPSIGKKTARRLNRLGIFTVEDFLNCDVEEIAFEMDVRHIDEQTLEDWKAQALLMIEVPGLRVHDAQILVGAGVRSGEDLANASATRIFHASMGFLKSSGGANITRDDHVLQEAEVSEWIGLAKGREAA